MLSTEVFDMPILGLVVSVGVMMLAGFVSGMAGIGGVIIIPALVYVGGVDVKVVAASIIASGIFGGGINSIVFLKKRVLKTPEVIVAYLGVGSSAFVGSFLVSLVQGVVIEILVVAMISLSGTITLRSAILSIVARRKESNAAAYKEMEVEEGGVELCENTEQHEDAEDLTDLEVEQVEGETLSKTQEEPREMNKDLQEVERAAFSFIRGGAPSFALACVTCGIGSALTGTGGPFVMAPLLLMSGVDTLITVAVAQIIILPTCILATIGFFMTSVKMDFGLVILICLCTTPSKFLGIATASRVPADYLKIIVSLLLIGTGLVTIFKVISRINN